MNKIAEALGIIVKRKEFEVLGLAVFKAVQLTYIFAVVILAVSRVMTRAVRQRRVAFHLTVSDLTALHRKVLDPTVCLQNVLVQIRCLN